MFRGYRPTSAGRSLRTRAEDMANPASFGEQPVINDALAALGRYDAMRHAGVDLPPPPQPPKPFEVG